MARPIKTQSTNFNYRGPREGIGDLPCERRSVDEGKATAIFATYQLEDWERKLISEGHNIELGIWYIEPIPPVSISVTPAQEYKDD
jgi:hypothetical protein